MKNDHLYKKDAKIIIYSFIDDDDDFFPIYITHKELGGNYSDRWLEFQPELDELNIIGDGDEYICDNDTITTPEQLKIELEKRNFLVELKN